MAPRSASPPEADRRPPSARTPHSCVLRCIPPSTYGSSTSSSRREVAALDGDHSRLPVQEGARTLVAVQCRHQRGPVSSCDHHGMAGAPAVGRPGQPRGRRRRPRRRRGRRRRRRRRGCRRGAGPPASASPAAASPARSDALIPVAQSSATTARAGGGHVDHRGAQHHHDVVTPAVRQRLDRDRAATRPAAQALSACRSACPRRRPAARRRRTRALDMRTVSTWSILELCPPQGRLRHCTTEEARAPGRRGAPAAQAGHLRVPARRRVLRGRGAGADHHRRRHRPAARSNWSSSSRPTCSPAASPRSSRRSGSGRSACGCRCCRA